MGWWQQLGFGAGKNDSNQPRRSGRARRWGGESLSRQRTWGALEPLEERRLMAIDWQSSDAVRTAIIRAGDMSQYTPQQLANTTQWVVGFSDLSKAGQLGAMVSEHTVGAVPVLNKAVVWEFSPNLSAQNVAAQLGALRGLDYFFPLVPLSPETMAVPNDPYFGDQWHLQNTGLNSQGGLVGADANVVPAWDLATGAGVVIGIVDGGMQYTHPDLAGKYLPQYSYDFLDGDSDPAPANADDNHGTSVAGVAAANGNNGVGVAGASLDASLASIRLIGGFTTDATMAEAILFQNQNIDIYNNSWGYSGFSYVSPPLFLAAMEIAATQGRGGLGNVIVFAAGNSGDAFAGFVDVSAAGIQSSIRSITVAAIDERGVKAVYSQEGSAVFISGYTQGNFGRVGTTTTDRTGDDGYNSSGTAEFPPDSFPDTDYTSGFNGTSSAAPLVSGVIGLMLSANPNLSYRDVQEILVQTARKNDPADAGWVTNGAGHHVNHKYGFGAIDALPAVQLAALWTSLPPEQKLSSGTINVGQAIPDNNAAGVSSTTYIPQNLKTERVEVVFSATHRDRGDLQVELVSPDGTVSVLAPVRSANRGADYDSWTFSTVHSWGESSQGNWTLRVSDRDGNLVTGTFDSWKLNIYGSNPLAPMAVDDVAEGFEEIPLAIPVLANDIDDGLLVPSSIQIVVQPQHGTVSVNPQTGVITYTGNKDYFGTDSFQYTVADNTRVRSNAATVDISLVNINDAPVAVNDVGKTLAGAVVVDILANDYDVDSPLEPSTVTIVSQPLIGTAAVDPITGAITYTPPVGFAGGDILTYTITDADGAVSNIGTVRFRVGLPVSLTGQVYIDNNGNGVKDANEQGLAGVLVTLTKTDGPFTFTEGVITGPGGTYVFAESDDTDKIFPTGAYTLTEVQPTAFLDGADKVGSHAPASTLNDQFGGIVLAPGANSTGWSFAERGLKAEFLADYLGAHLFMASSDGSSVQSIAFDASNSADPLAVLAGLPGVTGFKVASDPPGLALGVNGQQSSSALIVVGLPGATSSLSAPAIQTLNGQTYIFDSWSDGATSNRTVSPGSTPQNLTAKYRVLTGPTTNYTYVLAAARQAGIPSISAELLQQLSTQLAQGGSRNDVATALWNSPENLGKRVDALYQAILHRNSDPAGRAGYVSRLQGGANENDLAAEMLAGIEYAQANHLTAAAFVEGLYQDVLGRNSDLGGKNLWVAQLNQGKSRNEVAKAFLTSEERLGVVVDQLYRDVLGRNSDAGGKALYVGMLKSGALTPSTLGVRLLGSDEFANSASSSQMSAADTAFAKALYADLTGRAPTASDLANWSLGVSLGKSRPDLVAQLWTTVDALGNRVDKLYQSILGRNSDPAGRTIHVNTLLSGGSEQQIAEAMYASAEYATRHATNVAYVDGLYRDVLGRAADAAGRNVWVNALNQGQTRAQVAKAFLGSDENYSRQIEGIYVAFLGRAADLASKNFYLGNFKQGVLNSANLIQALAISDEYFSRSGRRFAQ